MDIPSTADGKEDRFINAKKLNSMRSMMLNNLFCLDLVDETQARQKLVSTVWSESKTVAIIQLGLIRRHLHTPQRLYY